MRVFDCRTIWLLTLAALLCGIVACGSTSQSARSGQDHIVLGSGGGFTGAYSGYIIRGDGDVLAWQSRPGLADSVHSLFRLSTDSTDDYFGQLDAMNFRSIAYDSPGNLTHYVEQKSGDSLHVVRWGSVGTTPPEAITNFQKRVLEMIRNRTAPR